MIGDSVRLRAALENLIDNAVKFTDAGGVALSVTPARTVNGKAGIAFAVSDSGIGLSLKEIERLFRPFSQANVVDRRALRRRGPWAVLGQAARARDGRRHHGRAAQGRRHHLHADGDAAARQGRAPRRADRWRGAGTSAPLRLLSVEDNPFGRVVLNAILTELGHHAEFIGRGEAVAERLAQGSFDAVLMDMVLPGISGVEAIRRIRALDARSVRSPSSAFPAAPKTRPPRARPAPAPSWSSLCLRAL